jgi:hypothetical protein
MQTLNDIGVNKKAARVWFKLNEGTEISVKTAGGMSETAQVGDCIGQGTAGAALVSQVNLDKGLEQYFGDGGEDLQYGNVIILPLAYQDDIMKGSPSWQYQAGSNVGRQRSWCTPRQTCFIVCGSKRFRDKTEKDLKANPLMYSSFPVKQKVSDKYLGQVLHCDGVEASATATVQERMGKIKGATMEIRFEHLEVSLLHGSYGRGHSYPTYSVELAPGWVSARKLLVSVTKYRTSIGE